MNRPIKACEVLPGDTVRYDVTRLGVEYTEIYKVSAVSDRYGEKLFTIYGGAERQLQNDTELTLIDRPALQLPTELGSVIVAYEVRGERNEDGWRLMLCDGDPPWMWASSLRVDGKRWHAPEDIFDLLLATVTTKETGL